MNYQLVASTGFLSSRTLKTGKGEEKPVLQTSCQYGFLLSFIFRFRAREDR